MDLYKKKKALSDEDFDKDYGRHWIWSSLDPESKLILNFVVGHRTLEDCRRFIDGLMRCIKTKPLFTSDELPHYETVLVEHFSHLEVEPKTGKRGRPRKPKVVIDPGFNYATVHKTRENGHVVKVERNIIHGDEKRIQQTIDASPVSNAVNTSFIERANLTLRNHTRRLTRKTLCFSKIKQALEAHLNIAVTYYNFSLTNRSLTLSHPTGQQTKRTPGMAANLINRIWPMKEIIAYPIC